ncbi:MAG: hypothetical protein ACREBQ_11950 [Nitrososphaerales archaeon]
MMSSQDSVCPSCGARSYNGTGRQQQVAYVKELPSMQRPMFATAFIGLSIIGTAGAFLLAASYKFMPSIGALTQLASTFGTLSSFMPYFLALVGILSLGAVYGSLKGNRWAWKVGLVASLLELISIITPNLLGFVVGIVSIYFLTTKPVKTWFRK